MKTPILNLTADDREAIRTAVHEAMDLWPNAHLGDQTRRQDMRAAFMFLRMNAEGGSIQRACNRLMMDTIRYEDM